ncbi:MAG TPA: diguanylate cyclase [Solirubrobacteraceae bacterium]|nr:diguanylate cyclase [Solirubrobacteraceae bacterium]
MNRSRGLVPLGVVLFAVLAAFGVELHDAHDEGRRAAERRFEQRAQISAALTASVFDALGSLGADELARKLGRTPAARHRYLAKLVKEGHLGYAAVVDARGAIIDRAGRAQPPRSTGRAPGLVSDVHRSAGGAFVEFALPFKTSTGKRMLVEGVPVAVIRQFLHSYLRRLPNPDGTTLVVADSNGAVLARVLPGGGAARTQDPLTVAAAVPRTTWRLRLQAERARVLAGSGGGVWLGWLLLGGLALAIVAGLWLCARVIAASRRTSAANRALRESEGKMRALVGALEEAVFLIHADGSVELLNASAKALAEIDADVMNTPRAGWLSVSDDGMPISADETPAGATFATGIPQRRVIGVDRPGRERRWLDVSTRPLIRPGETRPYAVVSSCIDVTERQNLEAHLLDLADRDPLTGLWNRRRFEQDIAYQLDRCRRYDETAALVLMDIDGFKQVNDGLGHLAGDEVLCALGEALSSRLRSTDRAARLGGDEFAVLLLGVEADAVERVATDLAADLSAAVTAVQERATLAISVGTTLLDRTTGGVNEALEAADRAMYAVKQDRTRRGGTPAPPAPDVGTSVEMASLRALLAAVNARDSYTAMHSREVVTLARGVARRLGLDDAKTSEAEHIALLHDLGKIAIPDAILRKAGPLTSHEQMLMRQHPVVGAQILGSMPELAHLAPAVRAEHERWDGTGYPDGLAGEEIPIASRIALVCDAYHAMTSNRPYRRAMSAAAAREEIRREAGAQFCPYATAALLEVLAGSPAAASA